jgi:two-component system, response regulator PdtaR
MMSGVGYHLQLAKEGAAGHIILVVEDEVLVRMVIADQLRNAGYTVIEAADAQQALDTLAHGFDVKLVVSDIQMPGSMDGIELARVVRSAHPAIKIVLTTGHVEKAVGVEHDGLFGKPYDAAMIIKYIETLLR